LQYYGRALDVCQKGNTCPSARKSWDELWHVARALKETKIKPPDCLNYNWAAQSRTPE